MDPGRGSHQRGDDGAGDTRQVVDFHTSVINSIHERVYYGGRRQPNMGVRPLQPHRTYTRYMLAPFSTTFNPATACTTRYVKTCQNNHPYVVNKVVWNPGARMLLTGSAKGEFTLWRLPDFSYERLIQHHTQAVTIAGCSAQATKRRIFQRQRAGISHQTGITDIDDNPLGIGQGKQGMFSRTTEIKYQTRIIRRAPEANALDIGSLHKA